MAIQYDRNSPNMGAGQRVPRRSRLLVAGLSALLLLSLLAPVVRGADPQPVRGGTMVIGLGGNPPNLILGPNISFLLYQSLTNVYSFLIRYDKSMNWKPDLAQTWDISSDRRTFTFHLVKNALWHDGQPFTADDVKFSIEEIHAKFGGNTENWKRAQVTTPDPHTVVIQFDKFDALFERILDHFTPIYPKHILAGHTGTLEEILKTPFARSPIGTGPFKFKEYQPGNFIELVRNDTYFKPGLPYLDKLVFRILPSAESRLVALEKGEIDLMPRDVPFSDLERLKKIPSLKADVDWSAQGKFYTMLVNTRQGPLAKREVRQAISYAIDRERVVQRALFGQGNPAWDPLVNTKASHVGEIADPNLPKYPFDAAKAKQLLDAAGVTAGADGRRFKARLLVETSLPANVPMAELIKDNLEQVGISVDIQKVDTATAQDVAYTKWDFDLYLVRIVTFNSPVLQNERRLTSQYIRKAVSMNASGYSNSDVDSLYQQAISEPDTVKRTQALRRIQSIVATDLPIIPVAEEPDPRVYSADLGGMPDQVQGSENSETVYRKSLIPAAASTAGQAAPAPAPSQSSAGLIVLVVIVVIIAGGGVYAFAKRRR